MASISGEITFIFYTCNFRRKRHQKYSTVSTEYRPERTETPSPTPENDDKDKLDKSQDMASDKSSDKEDAMAVDNAEQKDGQQTATEELLNKEDVFGYSSLDVVNDNSDIPEKDRDTSSAADRYGESSEELSQAVNQNEQDATPRLDGGDKLSAQEMKKESKTLNGLVPSGIDELPSELSETNESSNLLVSNPKRSASRTLWRNVRGSFTKSSDSLAPVHIEAQVSSADFNVTVVAYKRSTSRDYTKIDVHDHDDDEDHSVLYSDISTSWATSFWTQFTVLLKRTFKQSKPDILSKLNFTQVCTCT